MYCGSKTVTLLVVVLSTISICDAEKSTKKELGFTEQWYHEYELASWAHEVTLDNIAKNPRSWVEFIVVVSAMLYVIYYISQMVKEAQKLQFSFEAFDDGNDDNNEETNHQSQEDQALQSDGPHTSETSDGGDKDKWDMLDDFDFKKIPKHRKIE